MKYHRFCNELDIIKPTEFILVYTALTQKIQKSVKVKTHETWKKKTYKILKLRGSEYAKLWVTYFVFLKWPWTHLK